MNETTIWANSGLAGELAPDRKDDEIADLKARTAKLEKERDDALTAYWETRAHLELRTKGVFIRKEFNKVRSVLHADRANLICGLLYPDDKAKREAEEKRYAEAFDLFSRCEKLLKNEPPPKPRSLPGTRAELMEARLRVLKENRARGLKAAETRAWKKPGRQLGNGRPRAD
jgi:hypothetical protein